MYDLSRYASMAQSIGLFSDTAIILSTYPSNRYWNPNVSILPGFLAFQESFLTCATC